MSARATIPPQVYLLERINHDTGLRQTAQYTGHLRDKPKGWRVVRCIGYQGE